MYILYMVNHNGCACQAVFDFITPTTANEACFEMNYKPFNFQSTKLQEASKLGGGVFARHRLRFKSLLMTVFPAFTLTFLCFSPGFGQLTAADKKTNQESPALFSVSKIPGLDLSHDSNEKNTALPVPDSITQNKCDDTTNHFNRLMADTISDNVSAIKASSVKQGFLEEHRKLEKPLSSSSGLIPNPVHEKKPEKHLTGSRRFDFRAQVHAFSRPRFIVGYILVVLCAGTILFIRFTLKKANRPAFVTTTRLSIMDKEVQNACRYIEKNFRNTGLSLDLICEELVTGKAFLNSLFVQELGLGVEEFIVQVRINRARMFLDKAIGADAAITAHEAGFTDTIAFKEAFKKITGFSFDDYQKNRANHHAS
jgi:AraC-like DNA-binding protein